MKALAVALAAVGSCLGACADGATSTPILAIHGPIDAGQAGKLADQQIDLDWPATERYRLYCAADHSACEAGTCYVDHFTCGFIVWDLSCHDRIVVRCSVATDEVTCAIPEDYQ